MIAEIISIGDELTSGQRLDTNSQWLSQRLGELGIRVVYHTTVADDLEANIGVFRQAGERADLIVATGGLGPTADDLTREALAAMTGRDLVLDEPSLTHIQALFARRGREMPPRNIVQAMFPAGSRVVPNPHGSAPGIDLDVLRPGRPPARLFALPGVPAEMKEMWEATIAPALMTMGEPRLIRHRQIKCFGVGESDLEQMLPDLIRRGRVPSVGITVSKATITLRISAEGPTVEACTALMEPTAQTIRECLGNLIFGEGDDELQHAVVQLLLDRGASLATAEWGTGGTIANWLTEVERASDVYRGGVVLCSRQAAQDLLQSAPSGAAVDFSSGADLVAALATACRVRFGTTYGLAIGEFPVTVAGGTADDHFQFALATPEEVVVRSSPYSGHPDILKARSAKQALNLLRLTLATGNPPTLAVK